MVEVFGVGTAVHFSPKDLGLNAEFLRLFEAILGLIFGLLLGRCVLLLK